jgi:uncharacterized protein YecE (DUF72 family)
MSEELGPDLRIGDHRVLTGSCSWTDPTLVRESDWYPRKTMSAEERLRYYASQFPVAEIDSTYYAPPAEEQARLWAERTPDGFRFDVKAYSLLTGHPTRLQSLWSDLRDELPADVAEKRNLYAKHLSAEALGEAWRRFAAALGPLVDAGRLGAVLFQYPPWFGPRRDNRREIAELPERLGEGLRICVEFRSPAWLATERDRERTLDLLRQSGLILVCLDAPPSSGLAQVFTATRDDLLVVRFHGRNDETWKARTRTAAERFRYLYSEDELRELVPPLAEAAEQAAETHLLMNNCYRDYSVRGAAELRDLLARYTGN